jgi:hypothetical protein
MLPKPNGRQQTSKNGGSVAKAQHTQSPTVITKQIAIWTCGIQFQQLKMM